MQKRWIAGLGNPGKQYERTRHNAGFLAVHKLAKMLGVDIDKAKHQSLYARADMDGVIAGYRRGRASLVRTWIRRTRPWPHSAPRRSRSLP